MACLAEDVIVIIGVHGVEKHFSSSPYGTAVTKDHTVLVAERGDNSLLVLRQKPSNKCLVALLT